LPIWIVDLTSNPIGLPRFFVDGLIRSG